MGAAGPSRTTGLWKYHQARFGNGGAEMFVYDVNGDGIPDIITSLAAHGAGLSWFEQKKDGSFQEHLIMGDPNVPMDQRKNWEETDKTVAFTELHSMNLADMDGDGLKDIVTGKRWYSHGYHYDEEDDITDPPVVYVFQLKRKPGNQVEWVPQLIHNRQDAAIQLAVADVDGDGKPDIVTSGRKGTVIFFQQGPGATSFHDEPGDRSHRDRLRLVGAYYWHAVLYPPPRQKGRVARYRGMTAMVRRRGAPRCATGHLTQRWRKSVGRRTIKRGLGKWHIEGKDFHPLPYV